MEAVEEDDPEKLEELAGSFGKVVGKFNTEDLIQNEELHKNFAKFFHYLKTTSEEKHRVASKQLLKSIVSARKTPTESKFENLKLLISDLSEEDLASTLWEEILGNDKFDSLSFSIFSRLIDKERHKKISTSLHALFHSDNPQNRRSETESKIRILLSGVSSQLHSEMYRQTLSNVLNEIAFDQKLTLDHTAPPAELPLSPARPAVPGGAEGAGPRRAGADRRGVAEDRRRGRFRVPARLPRGPRRQVRGSRRRAGLRGGPAVHRRARRRLSPARRDPARARRLRRKARP